MIGMLCSSNHRTLNAHLKYSVFYLECMFSYKCGLIFIASLLLRVKRMNFILKILYCTMPACMLFYLLVTHIPGEYTGGPMN